MLRVEQVTKTYFPPGPALRLLVRTAHSAPVHALRGVDFDVRRGEIVGLVGPNGAGKSTLIRICTTLLTPTSGRVLVDGTDISHAPRAARAKIGLLLADERALYWRLTGFANLRFFGVMAGLSPREATQKAERLMREFGLADRDRRVFGYSSGMRVRLGLARALIASPELLILDEPSRSLDPVASLDLQERLRDLADRGHAVLLSSHRLDEIEAICDRILVVVDGRQRAWGTASALRRDTGSVATVLRDLLRDGQEGTGYREGGTGGR